MLQKLYSEKQAISQLENFSQYWEQKVTVMFGDVLLEKNAHTHLIYRSRKSHKT